MGKGGCGLCVRGRPGLLRFWELGEGQLGLQNSSEMFNGWEEVSEELNIRNLSLRFSSQWQNAAGMWLKKEYVEKFLFCPAAACISRRRILIPKMSSSKCRQMSAGRLRMWVLFSLLLCTLQEQDDLSGLGPAVAHCSFNWKCL